MQTDARQDDQTAARTFGALATRLNEALGQARAALDPHAGLLPEGLLAEIDALRAEFARRRIRIALYGEVKAGKSTLIDALAGAVLSPVAFEPLTSIPVRVTYGPATVWRLGERRLSSVGELEQLMREHPADAHEVIVETNLDLLQLGGQVDLLDTPGVGSAEDFDAVSAEALRSLDAVVLVVRYPALFTQYTRRLMDGLRNDIGKLFVVWNLDAACAELAAADRARHAATLRANLAGVHELYLLDARAGLRAAQADDAAGMAASGLAEFSTALARFASSGARELTALREAAKRAHQWFGDAHRALSTRHAVLDRALADARGRLRAAEARAAADAAAQRAQRATVETAVTHLAETHAAAVDQLVVDCRRTLRRARRAWMRSGDATALAVAIAAATRRHAEAVDGADRATLQSMQTELRRFGAELAAEAPARTEPAMTALVPDDRRERSVLGHAQWLRRAVWHRWYLPGLAVLERTGIPAHRAAQADWLGATARAARTAADATLADRLAAITARTDAEKQQIQTETDFLARQAEFDQLSQHVPIVAAQLEAIVQVNAEARHLL